MKSHLASVMILLALTGCERIDHSKAKAFYANNGTSVQKQAEIGKYSLSDQWEIYEYGLSKIEPPPVEMSEYLAQSGRPMLDYLIEKISKSGDEKSKADASFVFIHMQKERRYNICASDAYMKKIKDINSGMKDAYSASVYSEEIDKTCRKYSY